MADVSITAANALLVGGPTDNMTAGASITAGQVVYKEATTGLAKLADCDSATAEARTPYGIALHAASTGQPLKVARAGATVNMGATLTGGTDYWLSGTAGGVAPRADVASGDRVSLIGVATSAANMKLVLLDTGVTL